MELNSKKTVSAMTLLDAVLALAMFGIFFGFIVNLLFLGQDSVIVSGKRQQAALLAQEAVAAVESIVRRDFRNIVAGDYALSTSSNRYSLSSSSVEHLGIFDRTINITAIDYLSRAVTVTVSWMQNLQRSGSISMAYNLYNWALGFVYDHGKVKFDANYRNSVQVVTAGSTSSVELLRAGDWSRTTLFKTYDMTGSTVPSDVSMYRYYLYVSKLISAGGPELARLDVNNLSAGEISQEKTWTFGRPLLASYFDDNLTKAYFASTNPNEISILDLTNDGISSINVAGTVDPADITVNSNKIFLAKTNDVTGPELEIYDTSGTRVGSAEIGANATKVLADNNYAYVTSALDAAELRIINHTSCSSTAPFACPIVRSYDMAGTADATALTKGTSTNWYLGRSNGSLYSLNIPDPLSITQTWTNAVITASIKDLNYDASENLLTIAANRSATQELSFYDFNKSLLSSRDMTGTLAVNSAMKYGAFVYAGSSVTTAELQVVRALGDSWASPTVSGVFNAPSTTDATRSFVSGTTAYVALNKTAAGPELYIVNVLNPDAPALLSALEINENVSDVWVNGDYAYLSTAGDAKEMVVVDVSDKAHPSVVGTVDLPTAADGLSIVGDAAINQVFVGTANNTTGPGYELYGIDVSGAKTTSSLTWSRVYNANGAVYDLDFDSDHKMIYLSTGYTTQELQVVDVSVANVAVRVDAYNTANNTAYGVDYDPSTGNSFVSLANGAANDDFYMLKSTNVSNIVPDFTNLSGVAYNGDPTNDGTIVKVDNQGYAYLGTVYFGFLNNDSFYILDISQPANPRVLADYNAGGTVWDVQINGNYAYLATNNASKELQVLDISNKNNPVQAAYYNIPGSQNVTGLDQIASTTYAASLNDDTLYAFDTTNPNAISLRGSLNTGRALREVSAGPDYVFAATQTSNANLLAIDVRNWSSMSVVGTYNAGLSCNDLFYEKAKDRVLLGCNVKSGNPSFPNLFVIDARNPSSLSLLSSKATSYNLIDMYLWGTRIYLTSDTGTEPVLIYNINSSSTLDYINSYDVIGAADAVAFDGQNIYVAAHASTAEFQVVSPAWTTTPFLSLTKSLDLNSDNYGVVASDDYAFVATGSSTMGLKILDIAAASSTQVIATQSTGLAYGTTMSAAGDLYLTSGNDVKELQIFRKAVEDNGYIDQGWVVSMPYNSGLATTRWKYLSWEQAGTGSVLFNLRTAPDNAGVPGTWTEWLGPITAGDNYTVGSDQNIINSSQANGVADQWLQYRAILRSHSSAASPKLDGVTIYYE